MDTKFKKILKQTTLFGELDDKTLDELREFTHIVNLKEDNIIFYEGEESNYVYLVVKGIVKLYKMSSRDKEIVLKYFHENELIAELANFEHIPYPATAKAFTDISILKMDFYKLKVVIDNNPKLHYLIQSSLIKKIRNLEKLISIHLVLDAKERLAKYIYDHSDDFFKRKNFEIASKLNIAPETLSRILKEFKRQLIINKSTNEINKEKLQELF